MKPAPFPQHNTVFKGDGKHVGDMPALTDGSAIVSSWQIEPRDLLAIIKYRRVWLTVFSGDKFYPTMLTSTPPIKGAEPLPSNCPLPVLGMIVQVIVAQHKAPKLPPCKCWVCSTAKQIGNLDIDPATIENAKKFPRVFVENARP